MQAHSTYNIPQIPGLPVHPGQVAEQKRLEQLQQLDAIVSASNPTLRRISPETLAALKEIRKQFRNAPPLHGDGVAPPAAGSATGGGDTTRRSSNDSTDHRASLR